MDWFYIAIFRKIGPFFLIVVLKFKFIGRKMKFRNKNIYFQKKISYIYYWTYQRGALIIVVMQKELIKE